MNWEEKNVSSQALRILHDYFATAKLALPSGNQLSFFSVKASGEALMQKKKSGVKVPLIDFNMTLDFKLKTKVQNGTLALTGQLLIREFTGKDEIAFRVVSDEHKGVDGAVGNVDELLTALAQEMRKDGVNAVKEWLGTKFIEELLQIE
jgi:hypothetical protein